MEALNPELRNERTGRLVRCRTLLIRNRSPMIEDDDDALGMITSSGSTSYDFS